MRREVSPAHMELLRLIARLEVETSQAPISSEAAAEPRPPADRAWFERHWRMLEDLRLAPDVFTWEEKRALEAQRARVVKRKP